MQLAEARRVPPLAGREAELGRLSAALDDALRRRALQVVFVRGPAGVGRTALLDTFIAALPASVGAAVVGRAERAGGRGSAAFSPLSSLLPALRTRLSEAGVSVPSAAALAPLEGRDGAAGLTLAAAGEALATWVTAAAASAPLVLVLDDVDAAESSTQAVLGAALAALTTPAALRPSEEAIAGALLVIGFRDDALPAGLEAWLSKTPGISLPLAPLDLDGLRAWLDRGRVAERLLASTGGVPARLEDLLSHAPTIDLAARRLERLAPAERELLAVLALFGAPASASDVARVSGRKDAGARLTRLAEARFVQSMPGAGVTLHALVRPADAEVVLAQLPEPAQRALAATAAAVIEASDPVRATELYLRAGDTMAAVSTGLPAADRLAEQLQFERAGALLAGLTALPLQPGTRVVVESRRARVFERAGDVRAALASVGRARRSASQAGRVAFRAQAARLVIGLGAPVVAERLARLVLASDGVGGDAREEAHLALTEARFLRGAYEETLQLVGETPPSLALANVRGKALLTLGRLDEARLQFEANATRAQAAGDATEHARALLNVGVVAHRAGDRTQARESYRRAIGADVAGHAAVARANLSSLLLEDGRADEALSEGIRAVSAFRAAGRAKEQAHATVNLARVHLYLGDVARGVEVARHAGVLASRVGDPYLVASARLVLAELELESEPSTSLSSLTSVADAFATLGNRRYEAEARLGAADAALLTGALATARSQLDQVAQGGAFASPAIAAEHALLLAELRLSEGDLVGAASSCSAAKRALVAEPHLERPARLYLVAARLAEARGEPETARADRLQSVRVLEELASRLPPERRALFWSRRGRRAVLEAVGVALRAEAITARPVEAAQPGPAPALVGRTPAIVRVNALIDRIGPSMATVLVRGESGTGKELVARALHARSERRALPLVAVNCGALNEELLLSELFGHEKGAFTGAVRERKGRFEQADGGTLFLDEVGDISPRAQVALLRALQEREFERVGGNRTVRVDVRVICATNRNLEELMARGRFREDLYYRLRGATLHLPSLRERPDDLPLLCDVLLARQASDRGTTPRRLTGAAMRLLSRHPWPGNVRELQNVLESASLLSSTDELAPESFELFPELFAPPTAAVPVPVAMDVPAAPKPAPVAASPSPVAAAAPAPALEALPADGSVDFYALLRRREVSLKDLRQELEFACISKALAEGAGNISEAARLLGMKRSRLSQIVNAEPALRAMCRGGTAEESDETGDEAGPDVADVGTR